MGSEVTACKRLCRWGAGPTKPGLNPQCFGWNTRGPLNTGGWSSQRRPDRRRAPLWGRELRRIARVDGTLCRAVRRSGHACGNAMTCLVGAGQFGVAGVHRLHAQPAARSPRDRAQAGVHRALARVRRR